MEINLETILALPVLRSATVRTAKGACDRLVKWITVIEPPAPNFVREGEFVLCTAMGCDSSPHLLEQFVEDVASAKAAAIGIVMGHYIDAIPAPVVALAERHRLPIIEMPRDVRSSDVSQAVLDAEEYRTLEAAQQIQQTVFDLILRGGTLSDVAGVVQHRIGRPTLIVDVNGTVLGSKGGGHRLQELFAAARETESKERAHASGMRTLRAGDLLAIEMPIRATERVDGYLLLGGAEGDAAPFTARQRLMLEHVSIACGLLFLQQYAERSGQEQLRESFVWSLALGGLREDEAAAKCESLGCRMDRHHACLVGLAEREGGGAAPSEATADDLLRMRQLIAGEVARVGAAIGTRSMTAHRRDRLLVYVEDDLDAGLQDVHRFLDRLDERLHETLPQVVVSWGIASVEGAGAAMFSGAYRAAQEALEIGYRQNGRGQRTASRDVRLHRALMRLSGDPDVRSLMSRTLSSLLDYDRRKHGSLIPTLVAFVRARGRISETGRILNVHRQSLLYRLNKIESLTGRSLSDPEHWFLLSFALRLAALDGSEQSLSERRMGTR